MTGRRILLTGASGFIGGALLERLLADGYEVLAFCGSGPLDFQHPKLEWLSFDLLHASDDHLAATLDGTRLDRCIHTAWYTNPADYLSNEVNREWVGASLRLRDAFYRAGGRRFVALGTCAEYDAAAGDGCCREDETPLRPRTLYGECKLALYRALKAQGGDFAWARVFFVYGPGDRGGRLIPHVLETLARGEAAEPRTGGLRRDYIHVKDLAGQLARIATGGVRGAINTGTGEAVTISHIFETAADLYGRADLARPNAKMGRDQPPLIQADLARFRAEVGAPGTRSLRQGLAGLIRVTT